MSLDKLERLLTWQAEQAQRARERAFHASMADLQAELPIIGQRGEVGINGSVRNRYSRYEDIMRAIQPLLHKHGFSVAFPADFKEDGYLHVTGIVSHREGHQIATTLRLPFDTSGQKNNVQAIGSSVSYGKRYVLCMLLNIATTSEDDDVQASAPRLELTGDQLATLRGALEQSALSEDELCARGRVAQLTDLTQDRFEGVMAFIAQHPQAIAPAMTDEVAV